MKEHKFNVVFIPPGCTRILQPLDIGINKVIKSALKEKYLKYQLENKNLLKDNTFKISRETMIQWCYEIWYDDNIITSNNIKNSFTKSSISFPMDGSKDDQFKFPDDEEISHEPNNKNLKLNNNNSNEIIN